MAIDIRATSYCSFGEPSSAEALTMISASFGDSSIGSNGLITTTGSCVVDALICPAPGTLANFYYIPAGETEPVKFPRVLRVLSSYSDPFRRVTQINVGCLFTYLSNLQEYESLDALNDPANTAYTEQDTEIITVPISAESILNECLQRLGVTRETPSQSLTNKFSVKEFALTRSYVQIISDLLVSESLCGYLNTEEELVIINLDSALTGTGTAVAVDADNLIDIAPLGNATPPPDTVLVNYSSLELTSTTSIEDSGPEVIQNQNSFGSGTSIKSSSDWTKDTTIGPIAEYVINYTKIEPITGGLYTFTPSEVVYSGRSESVSTTYYKKLKILNTDSNGKFIYEEKEVVDYRETIVREPFAKIAAPLLSAFLTYPGGIGGLQDAPGGSAIVQTQRTIVRYEYDKDGEEISTTTDNYLPLISLAYSLDLPVYFAIDDHSANIVDYGAIPASPLPLDEIIVERTVVAREKQSSKTKTITSVFGLWAFTRLGQKSVATAKKTIYTTSLATEYFNNLFPYDFNLIYYDSTINISESSKNSAEIKPTAAEITNKRYAKSGGQSTNNWRTQNQASISIAVNGSESGRRVTLSLPYAPDDTFYRISQGSYGTVASDASEKARKFGRVQNKLMIGSSYGVQLQTAVGVLPETPFSSVALIANGFTAEYKIDGIGWSVNSRGVVISCTGLFSGAIGGSGSEFWFPVASGITTLPETPPIVEGQITYSGTVPLGNETIRTESSIKTRINVIRYDYPLLLTTNIGSVSSKIKINLLSSGLYTPVIVQSTPLISIAANTFVVGTPVNISAPVINIALSVNTPESYASNGTVEPPPAVVNLTAVALTVSASDGKPRPPAAIILVIPNAPKVNGTTVYVDTTQSISIGSYESIVVHGIAVFNEVFTISTSTPTPIVATGNALLPAAPDIRLLYATSTTGSYLELATDVLVDWGYEGSNLTHVVDYKRITKKVTAAGGAAMVVPITFIGIDSIAPTIEIEDVVPVYDTINISLTTPTPTVVIITADAFYGNYVLQNYTYESVIYVDWWGN